MLGVLPKDLYEHEVRRHQLERIVEAKDKSFLQQTYLKYRTVSISRPREKQGKSKR